MSRRAGTLCVTGLCLLFVLSATRPAPGQDLPPALTAPVNDFANVLDRDSAQAIDSLIRSLQQATGDVVVVATIDTFAPYGDIREYAVKMFENGGRGIGARERDNGLLILVAVQDRRVWVEVGYDLEAFITDGFAGETSRRDMVPAFRRGDYGAGVLAGTSRIIGRIADGRNVTLSGLPRVSGSRPGGGVSGTLIVFLIVFFVVMRIAGRTRRGRRRGWYSGVGPFGGGFGGPFRGGGFGGGFGGFGGGRSGGGGGGGSW